MEKATEITEELIKELVYTFYDKVRVDPLLGPIFENEIDDWDHHLPKMVDFWSSVTLKSGRYKGRPVPAHAKLEGLTKEHFSRWLDLFSFTAAGIFEKQTALIFIERAHQIAYSLKNAIDVQRGILPGQEGALAG